MRTRRGKTARRELAKYPSHFAGIVEGTRMELLVGSQGESIFVRSNSMNSILQESRANGWADCSSAPLRIQERIIEIRSAMLAGRPLPKSHLADGVEARSSAFSQYVERKLFPTPKLPSLAARKRMRCLEDCLDETRALTRRAQIAKLAKLGKEIAAAAPKPRFSEEEVRAEHNRIFPWDVK